MFEREGSVSEMDGDVRHPDDLPSELRPDYWLDEDAVEAAVAMVELEEESDEKKLKVLQDAWDTTFDNYFLDKFPSHEVAMSEMIAKYGPRPEGPSETETNETKELRGADNFGDTPVIEKGESDYQRRLREIDQHPLYTDAQKEQLKIPIIAKELAKNERRKRYA